MSRRRDRSKNRRSKSKLEKNLPDLHFQVMCLGKRIFWTETSANFKADMIAATGTPMRSYQCPNCLQWHLTSQVDSKGKKTSKKKTNEYSNVSTESPDQAG